MQIISVDCDTVTNWHASSRVHILYHARRDALFLLSPIKVGSVVSSSPEDHPSVKPLGRQIGGYHRHKYVSACVQVREVAGRGETIGTCVSRSAAAESGRRQQGVATAKVVGVDGTVARYAAPVTAREALGRRPGGPNDASPCFVCSSDELRFDAPARALAEEELLQVGQLYFVLPASMLRRALSGPDMAALAVRATEALAAAAASGVSSSRRESGDAAPGPSDGKQRMSAARVAPLVFMSSPGGNAEPRGEEWYYHHHAYGKYGTRKTAHGGGADETVGKARRGAGYRSGGDARLPASVQRLSGIPEAID